MGVAKQVTEVVDCYHLVLRTIDDNESMTRDALLESVPFKTEEVMSAIHEGIQKKKHIYVNDFATPPKYQLTKSGKTAVPPKYVKDVTQYVPPVGAKHITGLAGKVDMSRPLKGPRLLLYQKLTRPMRPIQLFASANMEQNHGYVHLKFLERAGIIGRRDEVLPDSDGKHVAVVFRAIIMPTEKELKEPPKPKLSAALPNDPVLSALTQGAEPVVPTISNFSKRNLSVDEAIAELIANGHSTADIVLACVALDDKELRQLRDFKQRVERQLGDISK